MGSYRIPCSKLLNPSKGALGIASNAHTLVVPSILDLGL